MLEQSIDLATSRLTSFTKFLKDIVEEDGTYTYQDVKLLNFNVSNESVKKSFSDFINDLTVNATKDLKISKVTLYLRPSIFLIVGNGRMVLIPQVLEKMKLQN